MESDSRDQARQWVESAKNYYRSTGRKLALAEFSDPSGMFVRSEMYIFVLDFKGTMLAHGANSKFIGENFMEVKDPDGKFFIKEIIEAANMDPSGWVGYKWFNPATKEWTPKTTYFEVVDDMILCGGAC
jgi:hypothetical protein